MRPLIPICTALSALSLCTNGSSDAQAQTAQTSYYVNARTGDDRNSGTLTSPWASFENLATIPWDVRAINIYLDCKSAWRDQLDLSATSATPVDITIKGYGNCATSRPTLRGSDAPRRWTRMPTGSPGGDTIFTTYLAEGSSVVNQVYVDGQFVRRARFPDDNSFLRVTDPQPATLPGPNPPACNAADEHLLGFGSGGRCSVIDRNLPSRLPSADLIEAILNVRSSPYWIDTKSVTAYDGQGLLSLSSKTRYSWEPNTNPERYPEYYLEGKLWMLQQGSSAGWHFDRTNRFLYVRLPNNEDPRRNRSTQVDVSTRAHGIHAVFPANSQGTIAIDGIAIVGPQEQGILVENVAGVYVRSTRIDRSGGDGIVVYGAARAVEIANNQISNSVRDAIKVFGSRSAAVHINGNSVTGSGLVAARAGSPKAALGAVVTEQPATATPLLVPPSVTIDANIVTGSAYIGIRGNAGSTISNNYVSQSCLVLKDCGSIYTWNGRLPWDQTSHPATSIVNNIVENGADTLEESYGIYLDDFTNNATVSGNTVSGGRYSLLLHLSYDNTITNNTFYAPSRSQLYITENLKPLYAGTVYDNRVRNNLFFGTSQDPVVLIRGEYDNIQFGTFDGNVYSQLYAAPIAVVSSPSFSKKYGFLAWQQEGIGPNTEATGRTVLEEIQIKDAAIVDYVNTNLIRDGGFDARNVWTAYASNLSYVSSCSGGPDVDPDAPTPSCAQGQTTTAVTGALSSNLFPIQAEKYYWIRFQLLTDTSTEVSVTDAVSYRSLNFRTPIESYNTWQYYSGLFQANATSPRGIFQANVPSGGGSTTLDEVSITEVFVEKNPSDRRGDSTLVLNKLQSPQTLTCESLGLPHPCIEYVDVDGAPIDASFTLPPMGSKILVWSYNPFSNGY